MSKKMHASDFYKELSEAESGEGTLRELISDIGMNGKRKLSREESEKVADRIIKFVSQREDLILELRDKNGETLEFEKFSQMFIEPLFEAYGAKDDDNRKNTLVSYLLEGFLMSKSVFVGSTMPGRDTSLENIIRELYNQIIISDISEETLSLMLENIMNSSDIAATANAFGWTGFELKCLAAMHRYNLSSYDEPELSALTASTDVDLQAIYDGIICRDFNEDAARTTFRILFVVFAALAAIAGTIALVSMIAAGEDAKETVSKLTDRFDNLRFERPSGIFEGIDNILKDIPDQISEAPETASRLFREFSDIDFMRGPAVHGSTKILHNIAENSAAAATAAADPSLSEIIKRKIISSIGSTAIAMLLMKFTEFEKCLEDDVILRLKWLYLRIGFSDVAINLKERDIYVREAMDLMRADRERSIFDTDSQKDRDRKNDYVDRESLARI